MLFFAHFQFNLVPLLALFCPLSDRVTLKLFSDLPLSPPPLVTRDVIYE